MSAFTIAARELRALFLSPLAWVIAAVLSLVLAWLFLAQLQFHLEYQGQMGAQSGGGAGATARVGIAVLSTAGFIMLWIVPILAMRLVAEERARGTLALLLASPATLTEIVLGKFLGLFALLALMLAVFALMPLSLAFGTALDWGHLAAATLGVLLAFGAYAAIGLWCSSLTRSPTIAAVTAIGLMLLLYLFDVAGQLRSEVTEAARWISLSSHGASFAEGRFSTTDVAYYLIVMATFLTLTVRRLDADRLPS
jgi:ABC-2 type transport system permease protein